MKVTLLLYALLEDKSEMAKVLIERGANVNFINYKADGQTPLQCAATKDDPELTKMLIYYGVKVNTRNFHGFDALELSLHYKTHENYKLIVCMHH